MGTVQQAQLGTVVSSNIVGNDDSDTVPVGACTVPIRARGTIFDDPLHEAFALYGPTVDHAECLSGTLSEIVSRRGSDAIDHRAWERHRLLDPTRQVPICSRRQLLHGPAEARSIVGE